MKKALTRALSTGISLSILLTVVFSHWLVAGADIAVPRRDYVELLTDPGFSKDFLVSQLSDQVPYDDSRILRFQDGTGVPEWHLLQFFSKYDIYGATPVVSGDSVTVSNPGKTVSINKRVRNTPSITFELLATNEYDDPRVEGEAWPHLGIDQSLGNMTKVTDLNKLEINTNILLNYCTNYMGDDYDPAIHTGAFTTGCIVQNRNMQSAGYGDFFWLQIPIYDYRFDYLPGFFSVDSGKEGATGKMIYCIDASRLYSSPVTPGQINNLNADLMPYILEGFEGAQERDCMTTSTLNDLYVATFGAGWEMFGTFNGSITLSDLSLKAYFNDNSYVQQDSEYYTSFDSNLGWVPYEGSWSVQNGVASETSGANWVSRMALKNRIYKDFIMDLKFRVDDVVDGWGGVSFRKTGWSDGIADSGLSLLIDDAGVVSIYRKNQAASAYGAIPNFARHQFFNIRLIVAGNTIRAYGEDKNRPLLTYTDDTFNEYGYISLISGMMKASFDNVQIRPIDYNGTINPSQITVVLDQAPPSTPGADWSWADETLAFLQKNHEGSMLFKINDVDSSDTYTYSGKLKLSSYYDSSEWLGARIIYRYTDANNYNMVMFWQGINGGSKIRLFNVVNGNYVLASEVAFNIQLNTDYDYKIISSPGYVIVKVNGQNIIEGAVPDFHANIGMYSSGSEFTVKDVALVNNSNPDVSVNLIKNNTTYSTNSPSGDWVWSNSILNYTTLAREGGMLFNTDSIADTDTYTYSGKINFSAISSNVWNGGRVVYRYTDANNYNTVTFWQGSVGAGSIKLLNMVNGSFSIAGEVTFNVQLNTDYTFRIISSPGYVVVKINGTQIIAGKVPDFKAKVGMVSSEAILTVKNICLLNNSNHVRSTDLIDGNEETLNLSPVDHWIWDKDVLSYTYKEHEGIMLFNGGGLNDTDTYSYSGTINFSSFMSDMWNGDRIIYRYTDANNFNTVTFWYGSGGNGSIKLMNMVNGSYVVAGEVPFTVQTNTDYNYKIISLPGYVIVRINGICLLEKPVPVFSANVGMFASGAEFTVKNITLVNNSNPNAAVDLLKYNTSMTSLSPTNHWIWKDGKLTFTDQLYEEVMRFNVGDIANTDSYIYSGKLNFSSFLNNTEWFGDRIIYRYTDANNFNTVAFWQGINGDGKIRLLNLVNGNYVVAGEVSCSIQTNKDYNFKIISSPGYVTVILNGQSIISSAVPNFNAGIGMHASNTQFTADNVKLVITHTN